MKLRQRIDLFSQKYKDRNVGTYAAAAAFFLFLSIVPITVLLVSIVPYTPLTQDGVLIFLQEMLPGSINKFTTGVIAEVYGKQPGLLSLSALLTLWSAGKGMQAITGGLNEINGYTRKRSFLVIRVEACIYTLLLLIMLIITILIFVFGKVLLNSVLSRYINPDSIIHSLFPYRYLFEWIIYDVVFSVLYAWVPNRRTRPYKQLKGATLAAVSWTIFSWGFSSYLEVFNPFSMYGSLATVVILMIWLYTCMILLMTGALVNVYQSDDPVDQPTELLSIKYLKKLQKKH